MLALSLGYVLPLAINFENDSYDHLHLVFEGDIGAETRSIEVARRERPMIREVSAATVAGVPEAENTANCGTVAKCSPCQGRSGCRTGATLLDRYVGGASQWDPASRAALDAHITERVADGEIKLRGHSLAVHDDTTGLLKRGLLVLLGLPGVVSDPSDTAKIIELADRYTAAVLSAVAVREGAPRRTGMLLDPEFARRFVYAYPCAVINLPAGLSGDATNQALHFHRALLEKAQLVPGVGGTFKVGVLPSGLSLPPPLSRCCQVGTDLGGY